MPNIKNLHPVTKQIKLSLAQAYDTLAGKGLACYKEELLRHIDISEKPLREAIEHLNKLVNEPGYAIFPRPHKDGEDALPMKVELIGEAINTLINLFEKTHPQSILIQEMIITANFYKKNLALRISLLKGEQLLPSSNNLNKLEKIIMEKPIKLLTQLAKKSGSEILGNAATKADASLFLYRERKTAQHITKNLATRKFSNALKLIFFNMINMVYNLNLAAGLKKDMQKILASADNFLNTNSQSPLQNALKAAVSEYKRTIEGIEEFYIKPLEVPKNPTRNPSNRL